MARFSHLLVLTSFCLAFCSERYRLKFADTYRLFLSSHLQSLQPVSALNFPDLYNSVKILFRLAHTGPGICIK